MRQIIITGILVFAVGLLSPQILQAQGTITYLSNLGQASTGNLVIGTDSWMGVAFQTGNNANGYMLDSIQLGMTDASGNPSGFMVMLYTRHFLSSGEPVPGSNLNILNGPANPATSGIYTYTSASSITLSANTGYYIVLTAGTTAANGPYEWSRAGANYNPSGGWVIGIGGFVLDQSGDGSLWNHISGPPQFAITATPVPEPGVLSLLGLGGLGFLWHRRKTKAV